MLRLVCGLTYPKFGQSFVDKKYDLFFNLGLMIFICHFLHLFVGLHITISLRITRKGFKKMFKEIVRTATQHVLKNQLFSFSLIFSLALFGGTKVAKFNV